MRHVLAVAAVIVLSLGLGITAGYFSVDLTPPGLNLLRPKTPEVVATIEQQEKARTIQAAASGCKYCADMAELAKTFTRRAETARSHATALETALTQVSDERELFARRKDELKSAKVAASRAEAAASILTNWAGRCTAEDFCNLPVTKVASTCAAQDDSRPAAALLIAMSVRTVAQQCASATCPSVDCRSSASLRADMDRIEGELDGIGGAMSTAVPAQLPVGASTLNAEITRIADETHYVANMLPLLLDMGKASGDLPKLAPDLADQRAVSAADLATVMEQAAGVSDVKNDPRLEASWRLKSMAAHLASLGKNTAPATMNWHQAAEALGASLLDLARLEALADRRLPKVAADCDGSVASVAQQLREARAMLDHCRMRAACVGQSGATTTKASSGDIDEVFSRATATAQGLVANEIGEPIIAVGDAEPSVIEMLRSNGVCRKASELIQASAATPAVTQAVATAVPAALAPSAGAISPQDIVAGAVQSALNTPSAGAPAEPQVVPAAAPARASDPELTPATAPADRQQAAVPQFTGSAFGFAGGEGGPVVEEAPAEEPKK
jgi:hypothetical protein